MMWWLYESYIRMATSYCQIIIRATDYKAYTDMYLQQRGADIINLQEFRAKMQQAKESKWHPIT